MYVSTCMCMCVCVERDREREGPRYHHCSDNIFLNTHQTHTHMMARARTHTHLLKHSVNSNNADLAAGGGNKLLF